MTTAAFNWDKSTWTVDYLVEFNKFKEALANAVSIIIPDYSLEWILRTDASQIAVGSSLVQLRPTGEHDFSGKALFLEEPFSFDSSKNSPPMTKWDAHKLEAYACYKGILENDN
jgi:RNase H-like domain found in reverse transcriptase